MVTKIEPVNNKSKKILKLGAIAASAIIPAAYMTKLHVDMFKKEDSQNRSIMLNKMIGFFAGLGVSILLIHKRVKIGGVVLSELENKISYQAGKIVLAAIAPFAGLKIAKLINRKIYPDKYKD